MNETETEEPAEPVVDDDPDQLEAEEDDAETAPPEESEPTPEQKAAPAKSEKEVEKATKALESERNRHAGRVSAIMGEDAPLLQVCPRCWELAPGFIWPLDMGPVSDEQRAAVLESLGMGGTSEPELKMAEGVEECDRCDGYGQLRYPTKIPHVQTQNCPKCSGNGYVMVASEQPAWTPPPIDPAAFQTPQTFPTNGGQADSWGRPLGHPHYGQNPATVGV